MSVGCRRNAAVIGSLSLLSSLLFASWSTLTSGVTSDLYSVHFPESTEVGYAVGSAGVILKTTDGGGTWVPQTSGTASGFYSVYFLNNSTGFAVGQAGTAVKTTDGGTNWNPVTIPGTPTLTTVQFPGNGQTGYIVERPRDPGSGKVLKTTDGGDNWTERSFTTMSTMSVAGAFATENLGVIVGSGGLAMMTVDGCGSFQYTGPSTALDLLAAAYMPGDSEKAYLVGAEGVVKYSAAADTPGVFVDCTAPATSAYYGISLCGGGSTVGYIVGADGVIAKTTGGTLFLKSLTSVPNMLTSVCFPSGESTGYVVGSSGVILKTTDGGGTVPAVAEGRGPALSRTGIRVVSNPCRHGIALHSDADVAVAVFDALGRVVMSRAVTGGLNFLPLRKPGAYIVKAGAETARVVVTD